MAGKIVGIRMAGFRGTGIRTVGFHDGSYLDWTQDRDAKAQFLRILNEGEAVPDRSKVKYDIDPIDEDGQEVGPGDPRLQGFYVDAWVEGSEASVDNLAQTGKGDDDHGCTPVAHTSNVPGTFGIRAQAVVNGQNVGDEIHSKQVRTN